MFHILLFYHSVTSDGACVTNVKIGFSNCSPHVSLGHGYIQACVYNFLVHEAPAGCLVGVAGHSQDLQIICCFNSFVILLCQTTLDKQLKIKNSPQSRFRLSPNHYYPLTFKVKVHNPKIQLYLIQHILESSYKTFHVGKMEHVIAINILSSKNLGQFILMVKLLTYLSM